MTATWLDDKDKCETVVADAVAWLGMSADGIDPDWFDDPLARSVIEHSGDLAAVKAAGHDVCDLIDTWAPDWPTTILGAAEAAVGRLRYGHETTQERWRLVHQLERLGVAW